MNKLTEIKANYEKFKDEIVERRLPITELTKMLLDDMGHLISLLEEKDKALKRIIDYYNDTSTNDITACKAMKREAVNAIELNDALNTSQGGNN